MRWLNKDNPLINNLFFIVLSLTFFALSLYHMIFLCFFILFILYLILKIKNKIIIILCFSIILLFFVRYFFINYMFQIYQFDSDKAYPITYLEKSDDKYKATIKIKRYKIYLYTKKELKVGDVIKIDGTLEEIDKVRIKHAFDYQNYLKNNFVLGIIYSDNIEIIKHNISINALSANLSEYIDKYFDDDSSKLIKALVIGKKEIGDEINNDLKENGIVHLFAISGLHVSVLALLISKFLNILKINEKNKDIIIALILIIYLFVTNFLISIIRAVLMYVINIINKHKLKNLFTNLDIASIAFILIVLIYPRYIFNTSFILSFLVTFIIILVSNLIKNKNKIIQIFIISICANVATLPIVINMNYSINILSPIVNIFYISLVSTIILPITILVLIFPIFKYFYKYIVISFYYLIHLTSNISININLPYFSPYVLFVYLIILSLFILFKKKHISIILYLVFIIVYSNIAIFYPYDSIYFMYLNNGEASLIRLKNKTILVDCGDGYKDEVLMYLKSIGIKKIDYLFISHNHNDHYGGIDAINKEIKIKNIYISKYDDGYYRFYSNIKLVELGDVINDNNIRIEVLAPNNEGREINDNSLVLYFSFFKYDYHILFTGDMTNNINDVVINNLNGRKVDLIKIAHHGSTTSSDLDFLMSINAKKAVIMVGKKWINTLPSKEVIENLDKLGIDYYLSSRDYSVLYLFKKEKFLKKS